MSTSTYHKEIRKIMQEYIDIFADDYLLFLDYMKAQRYNASDDWGEVAGSEYIERKLFEMPDDLYAMLKFKLSDEAFEWFRTKEGSRWFATTFPKFRSSNRA